MKTIEHVFTDEEIARAIEMLTGMAEPGAVVSFEFEELRSRDWLIAHDLIIVTTPYRNDDTDKFHEITLSGRAFLLGVELANKGFDRG